VITPEELVWYLEDCIALKQEFPHLIAGSLPSGRPTRIHADQIFKGFDLVGDENVLKPLIDYIEPLLQFRERQRELGLDIPFIFHAGETLGDGTPADMNLYDAILLGTKRIGHGLGFNNIKVPRTELNVGVGSPWWNTPS
jgi:Adenosine/AMP deaminase.